jgi:hypothetical protein
MTNDPMREVKEDLQEYRNKQQGNQPTPSVGSIWRHAKSEKEYAVVLVANEKATKPDYPVIINYEEVNKTRNGPTWAKTLDRWYETMRPT